MTGGVVVGAVGATGGVVGGVVGGTVGGAVGLTGSVVGGGVVGGWVGLPFLVLVKVAVVFSAGFAVILTGVVSSSGVLSAQAEVDGLDTLLFAVCLVLHRHAVVHDNTAALDHRRCRRASILMSACTPLL
ncbi:hypothetical protein ACFXKE_16180 [Streptomyces sp. NPDC059202]|uniref:hypothetical protein n=1 Tax=unclassified Streptomyces TaxID=2593676 RepID=UPI003652D175